ncbi:MAG: hypothetical protein V7761_00960 [Amylibacter sp.]
MGSNATFGSGFSEETGRATVTLEHFSTNDICDQNAGVDNQIVFSPQIRWDLGHAMGRPAGKIHLGVEYTHFNNKFGVTGVDENTASIFLGFRF